MTGPAEREAEQAADDLNSNVYLAMSRINPNLIEHMAALLRSGHAIDPIVRNAMADAFEGKSSYDRVTFQVADQHGGVLGDYGERLHKFRRDMAIGRFIEQRRAPPTSLTLDEAKLDAEHTFGIGVSTCHTATLKHRAMIKWLRNTYPNRPSIHAKITEGQYLHIMEGEYFFLLERERLAESPRFS